MLRLLKKGIFGDITKSILTRSRSSVPYVHIDVVGVTRLMDTCESIPVSNLKNSRKICIIIKYILILHDAEGEHFNAMSSIGEISNKSSDFDQIKH